MAEEKKAGGGDSAAAAPAIKFDQDKLLKTVQTLQFGWFVGNVLTLLGFFYLHYHILEFYLMLDLYGI